MKNRPNLYFSLLFGVVLLIQLDSHGASVAGRDTLRLGASLTGNQTIISENGTFELGFFSPTGNNWYIGIWYAQIQEKTYIWIANRDTPLRNRSGTLKLVTKGNLVLFDAEGESIWSVNMADMASRAVLLDSGNFLLVGKDNESNIVWQSFNNPVDTWLPGMAFGGQRKLVSWRNSHDPASGLFSLRMDPSGAHQIVLLWNNSVRYWESGIWDGTTYPGVPELTDGRQVNYVSTEIKSSGFYDTYTTVPPFNAPIRLVMTRFGQGRAYVFYDNSWNLFWSIPRDGCNVYGACGTYGTCDSSNLRLCSCVEGFKPTDNRAWESQDWASTGCVRKSPSKCDAINGSTDGFMDLSVTLPGDISSSFPASTKKACQISCLGNCSCTAFSFNQPSGPCQIWSGDLLNMQRNSSTSENNRNVFIRVGSSQIPAKRKSPSRMGVVIGIVCAVTIGLGVCAVLIWRRHRLRSMLWQADLQNSFLRMYTYNELKIATRNFRSKLGSGGFGSVFKGSLPDGLFVAVKMMENSREDEKQFRAEVSCLGNIQHVNLVRLRGFCAEGTKRLLVYDYMPNGSLSSFLFTSPSKRKERLLDWKIRFEIVVGIARGLLYLHEECRERIIHGDVKPENILLDSNMSPKVADFGLAKLLGRDFSRVLTTTRGTRGYLAPEWIYGLPISTKVDVYSFGMTLFEIISGRRNSDVGVEDSSTFFFPSWAATQVDQENTINIVEKDVAEDANVEEVRRGCVVALLCIQHDEELRPSMRHVLQMLEGKMEPRAPMISGPSLGENSQVTPEN